MRLHDCSPSFFLPLLIGILSLIVSASATSHGVGSNEIVSSNIEANVDGDKHQLVQREAVPGRRRERRKGKAERSKKCEKGRNSCKKKSKSKKQEGGGRKRGKNLRGKKQTDKLEKNRKEGEKGIRSRTQERQSGVNVTACITKLIFYSRLNEKKASAISRQVKRIKGNDKIQDSKGKKNLDFNSTKERLLSALGGNASNPTCGGQPFNSSNSTSGRAFSQDTLATLVACETDIADQCGNPTTGNASKLAELEACETLANNFKSAFSKCFAASKSLDESCTCVEAISESDVSSMQACDVTSDNSAALKAKKACKAAVGKCKTAEAAAVEGIDTCKEETKCSTFEASQAEGTRLIENVLTPLNEALKNPAFSNALNATGLNSGAGADGQLPSSRLLSLARVGRQAATDGAGCTALDEEWTKFNVSGNKAMASADGSIDEASANETTEILNGINARTTLVEDLLSCANETSGGRQVAVAFTIIRIRIYVFWAQWWRQTIVETRICTIATTFNISTTTAECSSSGSATTVGGGSSSTSSSSSGTTGAKISYCTHPNRQAKTYCQLQTHNINFRWEISPGNFIQCKF